jgi:hypothetical protein
VPLPSWREKRRLQSLEERGRTALATVLEFDERWGISEGSAGGVSTGRSEHYTLKLRIEPPGEPSFEAEVKEHDFFVYESGRPQVGAQFAVLFDPDDHTAVIRDSLDRDSLVPSRTDGPKLNLDADEQERFKATVMAALEQQRAGGELTEEQYAKKKAVIEANFAAETPAPEPQRDVAAQLTDLAALHAGGSLTDAEFEAQKAKLLSGG